MSGAVHGKRWARKEPAAPSLGGFVRSLLVKVDYYERRDLKRGPANRFSAEQREAGVAYRSVGFPYDAILEEVQRAFPDAVTSIATLRWYGSHIRDGSYAGYDITMLPNRRPKSNSVRAKADAEAA